MKVTLLQIDIRWALPDANIAEACRLLSEHEGSDLYVLPEMWSTGFATEPEGIAADETSNAALQWMQEEARSRHCAISGSLAVRCPDGTYRNRHYFVDGCSSTVSYYDKHHLFTYGHEDRYYTAGQVPAIVQYEGFRLLLLTCYDLRFPVWSRYRQGHEFDAIVIVANWPENRQAAWQILTRARAVENQCYLVAVNLVGTDGLQLDYNGHSVAYDTRLQDIARFADYEAATKIVNLSIDRLRHYREALPIWQDADDYEVIGN